MPSKLRSVFGSGKATLTIGETVLYLAYVCRQEEWDNVNNLIDLLEAKVCSGHAYTEYMWYRKFSSSVLECLLLSNVGDTILLPQTVRERILPFLSFRITILNNAVGTSTRLPFIIVHIAQGSGLGLGLGYVMRNVITFCC